MIRRLKALIRPYLRKPTLKQVGMLFLWLIVLGSIAFFSLFIYLSRTLPDPESIALRKISESTKIFDRTGDVLLYDIHGEEKRTVVPWEDIPASLKNAVISAEDSSFYKHKGIDLKGIMRAFYRDITGLNLSEGGSTITQQLVKNALLGQQKTPTRKIKELILSIEIERRFSKDQILWMYLNEIPLGSNVYGVESASKTFFGKNTSELSLSESAIIASVLRAPSYYSPYGHHTDDLMSRKNLILGRMKDLGFITPEQYDQAKSEKIVFRPTLDKLIAPHFVFMVKDYLVKKYGEDVAENGGLKVTTTLDANYQEIAEEVVAKYSKINKERYKATNAALVSVNPKDGGIRALVGSSDYFDVSNQGNFNVVTANRQPGSSFKPFAYATLLSQGYPDSTVLFDLRTEFNPYCSPDALQTKDRYGLDCYHPQNYDGRYRGPVTLRQALDQSLNVPSVKVLYLAGVQKTILFAQKMGITTLTDPDRYGLSLVLGGAEVHPVDLASAYGVFANDGVRNPWNFIMKVEDANGNILEQQEDQSERAIPAQVARLMNSVLSDNSARAGVFGYNSSLYIPGREVAAKTGTTQENRDAWVAGYTPSLSTVVWTGNNDNTPMTKEGAGISASGPMWNEFMRRAIATIPFETFQKPDPVSSSKIMLDGNYTYTPDGGMPQYHTILYYVNRENPLGPFPSDPFNDSLFNNWEWAVQHYFVPNPTISPSPSPTL
ncbi:penicillin-binding protein [Candidatus Parcubacteria bacterium]|nr:penicillin-binding protein [Candidatus Parcubacteria bacterium]